MKISCVFSVIFLSLLLAGCIRINKNPVTESIFNALKEKQTPEDIQITLSDYTEFSWDSVVLYINQASIKEINREAGIDYDGSTDLTAGMIFVKDGKIVHKETFDNAYTDNYCKLIIWPSEGGYNGEKYTIFNRNDAVFRVIETENNGKCCYRLYP